MGWEKVWTTMNRKQETEGSQDGTNFEDVDKESTDDDLSILVSSDETERPWLAIPPVAKSPVGIVISAASRICCAVPSPQSVSPSSPPVHNSSKTCCTVCHTSGRPVTRVSKNSVRSRSSSLRVQARDTLVHTWSLRCLLMCLARGAWWCLLL